MDDLEGKTTVVLTYNSVKNFPAGTYSGKNGSVIVYGHENEKSWENRADDKIADTLSCFLTQTTLSDVKNVFLYIGVHAMYRTFGVAEFLKEENIPLTLVACPCSEEEKVELGRKYGFPIIWSECGGREALEKIVRKELGEE